MAEFNKCFDIYISNVQKIYDPYENKLPGDKLKCIICGGKYIRSRRSSHNKCQKHQLKMYDIKNSILEKLCT